MVLLQIYIVVTERLDNLVIGEVLKWWEKMREELAALDGWGGREDPGIGIVIRYFFTLKHLTYSYYLHN